MKLAKRLFVLFILLTLGASLGFSAFADDDDAQLPPVTLVQATNLQADAKLARAHHVPILLMFAQQGCSWCHFVEEDQLKPMLRNADYRRQVIIRQIMIDDVSTITDVDGRPTTAAALAMRYHAPLTPTVVFINGNGELVAPQIVGVKNTEFYGGNIDEGLAIATQQIRQQLALNSK